MTKITKSNKTFEEGSAILSDQMSDKPYSAITNDIHINVWPEFIDSKSSVIGDLFIWSYQVRIDNRSDEKIKLISRFWRIIDEKGIAQEISGDGVIGEQPTILPGDSYQYSSGVHLRYPSGIMMGKYQMQKDSGVVFDANIPTFSLDVPSIKAIIN
jgi:ApaG protein